MPCFQKRASPLQKRQGGNIEGGAAAAGAADRQQVPCKAKSGHIGHGAGAHQALSRAARAGCHVIQRTLHHASIRRAAHICGQNHTRAQRARKDEPVARLRASDADGRAAGLHQAGDGKANRQLGALSGVPADDLGPGFGHHVLGRSHDFGQRPRLKRSGHPRQDKAQQRGLRRRAHRPDITQRVQRGDTRHLPRIGDKGAQVICAEYLHPAADPHCARIVAGSDQHILALTGTGGGERCTQRLGPDLGAAAAADHGMIRQLLRDTFCGVARQDRRLHHWQIAEILHEVLVDPVLPTPQTRQVQAHRAAIRDGAFVAKRNQLEVMFLRLVLAHPVCTGQRRAKIVKEDRRGADGINSGLGAGRMGQMGAIACGEDGRICLAAQVGADGYEPIDQIQLRVLQPWPRACADCTDAERGGNCYTRNQYHAVMGDFSNPGSLDQGDSGLVHPAAQKARSTGRGPAECRCCVDHMQTRRVVQTSKTILHGQRQFDPRNAAAENGAVGRCRACLHACSELRPAIRIGAEGLGRGAICLKSGNASRGRGDADIDRQNVIGYIRSPRHPHAPRRAVDPGRASDDQPRPGKACETAQIDIQRAPGIMPGDMTGEHACIGRPGVWIDQRQPRAGQRVHAPSAQHQRMGVAAADQHQIAREGNICVHVARRSAPYRQPCRGPGH